MSQAHRPQWNPTQGRETKAGSRQISKLSLASYTKLKFRQPGQTSTTDVARRDLKAELAAAERVAVDKKRKAAGLAPLPPVASGSLRIEASGEEEELVKRRKVLEETGDLDRDDEEAEGEGEGAHVNGNAPEGKVNGEEKVEVDDADDDDDAEEDEEE